MAAATEYVAVVPYLVREYFDAFMATCKLDVFPIDNTFQNRGVMRSHNMGIDEMRRRDAEWLIVISAAIRFGEPGGLDFVDQLRQNPTHHVIEAAGVFGWHLIAFHARTIAAVGRWDENFHPYGFDDLDYSIRIRKTFQLKGQLWEKVSCDKKDTGMAHSIHVGGLESPAEPRIKYFREKWGRYPGDYLQAEYVTPFNNPANSLAYWPEIEICGEMGRWDG